MYMLKKIIVATALLLLPLSACRHTLQVEAVIVETSSGIIEGKSTDDGRISIFMGIPFAAPPLGDLRWKEPQPVKPWEGTRVCTVAQASAVQAPPVPFMCWSKEFLIPDEPISEDCLYLNVWTPARRGDKLPVMVWIHGGSFTGGSGSVPLYDGEEAARRGIVMVTINYRLGIFGFLAHPDLSAESPRKVSGNYGILDQIAALRWIKENIASFGGDPNSVTIAGQSAGAFSVNILSASPAAGGLFHRAIAQSGGIFVSRLAMGNSLPEAEERGRQLTESLGLSIKDLRSLPADSLLKIPTSTLPTIDNEYVIPIRSTFETGRQHKIDLLSGWNEGDGISFAPSPTAEEFRAAAEQQYGSRAARFLEVFPSGSNEEASASQNLINALFFGANNYAWTKLHSDGGHKSYLYYFRRTPPGEPNYGSFHSAEFAYALHTLHKWDRPFTEIDRRLEETMSSYWINFIKTGDPNGPNLPQWPAYDNNNPQVIELGDNVKAIPLPHKEQLEFFLED